MTINTRTLDDLGVLEVVYSSKDVTQEDLLAQRSAVADALLKSKLRKVLIDTSALTKFPPLMTIYEHSSALSSDTTLREAKFAVVCNSVGSEEQFLEDSARNRGVQLRCFTSKESALSWLSEWR